MPASPGVVLGRLVLRPDVGLVVAVLGTAAAILLPAAGTLVLHGLDVRVDDPLRLVYASGGGPVRWPVEGPQPDLAVTVAERDGLVLAAYTVGPPGVEPGQARPMPRAPEAGPPVLHLEILPRATTVADLVPADAFLVHASELPERPSTAALFGGAVEAPAWVVPARGADAFEAGGAEDLRGSTVVLVTLSLPAVALVAGVFADHEARARRRTAATLAALGRPSLGRDLLVGRVLLMSLLALAVAAAMVLALSTLGGAAFRPPTTPWGALGLALGVPTVVAAASGAVRAARTDGLRLLRAPPDEQDPPGPRLAWLPTPARPLVLGVRLLPVLLVAAALFVADVGVPIGAASVPVALAGGDDEWIVGAGEGLVAGGRTATAPAESLRYHPDIGAIVAEVLLPTTLEGRTVVLRGGAWADLATYHGLHLVEGAPPGPRGIVLGAGLADRIGARVGDAVAVQAVDRPLVETLRVDGLYDGPPILRQEGLVGLERGQALAGLAPDQATLLRVTPRTEAALAALSEPSARIEVVGMRLEPPEPVAGDVVRVALDIVNLGARAGARPLTVRVDGEAVAGMTATLPPHGHGQVAARFIAPEGAFRVDVNPTRVEEATAPPRRVEVPAIAFAGRPFTVGVTGADGAPLADVPVRLHAGLEEAADGADPIDAGVTGADGTVVLVPDRAGGLAVAAGAGPPTYREVRVGRAEDAEAARIEVARVWLEPPRPRVGEPTRLSATVVNVGGAAGEASIGLFVDATRLGDETVRLDQGATRSLVVDFVVSAPVRQVRAGDLVLRVAETTPGQAPSAPPARSGGSLQAEVADRVLGDAQRVLGGLASIALLTTLAVAFLATDRTLRGRAHVLGVLEAMGHDEAAIRRRAAWEGGTLGAVTAALAVLLGKAVFLGLGALGRPILFGHVLGDPVQPLFALQAIAAFAFVTALAAYLAAGRTLRASPLRGATRRRDERLPVVPVQDQLRGTA